MAYWVFRPCPNFETHYWRFYLRWRKALKEKAPELISPGKREIQNLVLRMPGIITPSTGMTLGSWLGDKFSPYRRRNRHNCGQRVSSWTSVYPQRALLSYAPAEVASHHSKTLVHCSNLPFLLFEVGSLATSAYLQRTFPMLLALRSTTSC